MMTVHEVSELTGVSIRTLQYYDSIGLLRPAEKSDAGYRLYDETSLEELQQILLFRELEFPLKDIRRIVSQPDFDQERALDQQIELLTLKVEHLQNLVALAKDLKERKAGTMDFKAFDKSKIDEYAEAAKAEWGGTPEYAEFVQKDRGRTTSDQQALAGQMMQLFVEFAALTEGGPDSPEAQAQVEKLQKFISEHYYHCTDEVLAGLGQMYGAGGDFTKNINKAAGAGAAEFAAAAIVTYCAQQ